MIRARKTAMHHEGRGNGTGRSGELLRAALVGAALVLGSCGDDGASTSGGVPVAPTPDGATANGPATDADDVAATIARERAAGLFAGDRAGAALAELEPLLERDPVDPDDLVRVAICLRELGREPERTEELLRTALAARPDDPRAHYVLGRHLYELAEIDEAAPHLERAAELAPDDWPARIAWAKILEEQAFDAEDGGDDVRAEELYGRSEQVLRDLVDRGIEFGGSWYLSTLYRLGTLLAERDEIEESRAVLGRWKELKQRDIPEPNNKELLRGELGVVAAPSPVARRADPPRGRASLERVGLWTGLPTPGRALAMSRRERWYAVESGDLSGAIPRPGAPPVRSVVGEGELFWASADGLWSLGEGGAKARLLEGDFARVVPIELGEDRETREEFRGEVDGEAYLVRSASSDLELVVVRGSTLLLFETDDDGAWNAEPSQTIDLGAAISDAIAVDADHDGDLDLIAVGAFGARLVRNDGAGTGGAFEVVPFEAEAAKGPFDWVVAEDLDTDRDTDLVFGSASRALLLDDERGGRFTDRSERLPAEIRRERAPLVLDLDGDAFPDLVPGGGRPFLHSIVGESFRAAGSGLQSAALASDVFASGVPDLVAPSETGLAFARADGGAPGSVPGGPTSGAIACDLDRDGREEIAAWSGGEVRLLERSNDANAIPLALEGVKDNARGVGATVEVRVGALYRRIRWNGEPLAVGLGDATKADVLRVTWPNGVVQTVVDVPANRPLLLEQIEGLVGSCPFLYTWDGEKFVFVTDVIGITPLGLPMAPGQLVPPDHDEWVLVRGEQLAPRRGANGDELVLQLTEELREVTYFDQVRLFAVDHPEGTEVFPNERFQFPPFPQEHLYTVESSTPVVAALDAQGRDWADELRATDGRFAVPFVPNRGQYLGLASPHTLELRFDADAVRAAAHPRLLMTGWLYWTDASVNVAAARHPLYEFVPPIVQIPDGAGGWKEAPLAPGFPAGKTKTMVLDLAGVIDPADPRLRIFSTLRLYWDEIRLATCDDALEVVRSEAPLLGAKLWERGFSRPVVLGGDERLEWFDWDHLADPPRWDQHPGQYTKLGEVAPLLDAIDDEFVIMGSGDALEVRFDASALPELAPGMRRDYLLFLDGWAKDRDPNTEEALFVEPLPFHGMAGYPPPAGTAYPDDAEHRAYRLEWNTRPAKRWIEPLVPRRR
ncbi:MAG: ASPIC/UnbV domain-containing protein [Planctomycetota bacterium]